MSDESYYYKYYPYLLYNEMMVLDKSTAVWVSHTSINDFLTCPRLYYLKHMYRDSDTGHKIKLMAPALALGQAVHEVIESLSVVPTEKRFDVPLVDQYERAWKKVSAKLGGFPDSEVELIYKNRGKAMIDRVRKSPGPLAHKAVKIKMDLPYYWLSEDDNIILCGKLDWLEYLEDTDTVHIIDFKTSKNNERGDSLQLPIYCLLAENCQKRKVTKVSYWYLDRNDIPTEQPLPNCDEAYEKILKIAKQMKVARQLERFKCEYNGCKSCTPYEKVIRGDGEKVGLDEYFHDIYILKDEILSDENMSEIL